MIVALQLAVDTLLSVRAAELIEIARQTRVRTRGRAVLLVPLIATVEVTVALLLLWDADAVRRLALEVPRRAFAEICGKRVFLCELLRKERHED